MRSLIARSLLEEDCDRWRARIYALIEMEASMLQARIRDVGGSHARMVLNALHEPRSSRAKTKPAPPAVPTFDRRTIALLVKAVRLGARNRPAHNTKPPAAAPSPTRPCRHPLCNRLVVVPAEWCCGRCRNAAFGNRAAETHTETCEQRHSAERPRT